MGRHKVSLAALPGVEYDESEQSLYVDIPAFLASGCSTAADRAEDTIFRHVYHVWRKSMPAYPVRLYHVRGVG